MADPGYLHAQEFARFLRTTKATLRHYREIGLFEPARVTESDYALYGLHQVSDYVLITALKAAGCSLKQIKGYLNSASMEELRDTLVEKVTDIEKEQLLLEQRKRVIETSIARTDALNSWGDSLHKKDSAWQMKERLEEYFIKTSVPLIIEEENLFFRAIDNHIEYCLAHGGGESMQATNGIEQSSFKSGDYAAGFTILTRLAEPLECDRLHIKEAGNYFCWLKRSTTLDPDEIEKTGSNPLYDEFDAIRALLEQQGLEPVSDIYEAEISLYSGSKSETKYSEIEMMVKPSAF